MEKRLAIVFLVMYIVLTAFSSQPRDLSLLPSISTENIIIGSETTADWSGPQTPDISGIPPIINIAVTGIAEASPKVAYCGMNQYLAVFTKNGDIYGQRIGIDSSLIGAVFRINEGESSGFTLGNASQPDVACEWSHGRYVIVWTYYYSSSGDFDIHAQGVYGEHQSSGSQLEGNLLVVVNTFDNETRPNLACNRDDAVCLVAYENDGSGNGDIYGRLVTVEAVNLSLPDPSEFIIGGFSQPESHADVAWGATDESFIVVWQYLYDMVPDPDLETIAYAMIYDTDQPGTQIKKTADYLIGAGNQQVDPAVAYNPLDDVFLAIYTLDSPTPMIIGKYLQGDGTKLTGTYALAGGYSSSVAWKGGAEAIPTPVGGDEFAVVYVSYASGSGYNVEGVNVGGTPSMVYDYYTGPSVIIHLDDILLCSLDHPQVVGTSGSGRYLSAWQYAQGGITPDSNIYGMLLSSHEVFLPLIVK